MEDNKTRPDSNQLFTPEQDAQFQSDLDAIKASHSAHAQSVREKIAAARAQSRLDRAVDQTAPEGQPSVEEVSSPIETDTKTGN